MARRAKGPEKAENAERWLLTYADLITLLLAFFVILYAMANVDIKKFENLKGSLTRAFNLGVLEGQSSTAIVERTTVNPEQEVTDVTEPQGTNMRSQLQQLQEQEGFADVIQHITQRPEGIAISISGTVAFVSGSAELTPQGSAILTQLVEVLGPTDNDLRIEGHTDSLPTGSGRYPTNWDLSTARATTIVRFFEAAGLAPYRLSGGGYADQRSIASNETPRGRVQNRRAEIVLLDPAVDLLGISQGRSL